jgi:hypothetical protein
MVVVLAGASASGTQPKARRARRTTSRGVRGVARSDTFAAELDMSARATALGFPPMIDRQGASPGIRPALHGTLDPAIRRQLADDGYAVLPGLIDAAWLNTLRARVEALYAAEGDRAGIEVHQEAGTRRLANLVDKGSEFDGIVAHPLVLAAVGAVIGRPFRLSSLNARDALLGGGHQPLHVDWSQPPDGAFHVCNSLWMLDDLDSANGCTRLVPGSHRHRLAPGQALADRAAPHPDEVLLTAPAGSVCIFNGHVWHGGTRNVSGRPRRCLHAYYAASEHPQQTDQRTHLSAATRARLGPDLRRLLGLDDASP